MYDAQRNSAPEPASVHLPLIALLGGAGLSPPSPEVHQATL